MNFAKILKFSIIILFSAFKLIFATNYYLDAINGNDSNSGLSPALAWKTINKINNSSFQTGDIISFKRGQVFSGYALTLKVKSRFSGITFNAYGSGDMPIIDGGYSTLAVNLEYVVDVKFTNIKFINSATNQGFFTSNHTCRLTLDSCVFDGQGRSGYQLAYIGQNTDTSVVKNCVFENGGTAANHGAHGLYITGHYFIIENNHFENFPDGEGLQMNCNYTGTYESSSHITVRYNYFKGAKNGDIGWQSGDSSQIYNNVIITVYKYESAIAFSHDGSVQNFGPQNTQIFNNTIIISSDSSNVGIFLYGFSEINNITIKNNLFYSSGMKKSNYAIFQQKGGSENIYINYNLYFSKKGQYNFWAIRGTRFKNFYSWQSAGFDINGKWGDPLFKNYKEGDYTLNDNSPAIKLGKSIQDFNNFRSNKNKERPNAGAF